MKCGVTKLLSGLLALYAAWQLAHLGSELYALGQQRAQLGLEIQRTEEEISRQTHELSAMQEDRSFSERARQLGFISKGDSVFFDGG
jgi:cell division protein FtsB